MKIKDYIKRVFSLSALSIVLSVLALFLMLIAFMNQKALHSDAMALENDIQSKTKELISLASAPSLEQLDTLEEARLNDIIDLDKEIIIMTNTWASLEAHLKDIDKIDYSSYNQLITLTMDLCSRSSSFSLEAIHKAEILISSKEINKHFTSNELSTLIGDCLQKYQLFAEKNNIIFEEINRINSSDKSENEVRKGFRKIAGYLKENYSSRSFKEYKLSVIRFLIYVRKGCSDYLNETNKLSVEKQSVAPDTNQGRTK